VFDRGCDQGLDGGFVERGGGGELDIADLLAGAAKQLVRIGELDTVDKAEADAARIGGDRKNCFGRALGRAEPKTRKL